MIGRWDVDDNRDELTPEPEPDCPGCGAGFDEPCDQHCMCDYCIAKRERQAERFDELTGAIPVQRGE